MYRRAVLGIGFWAEKHSFLATKLKMFRQYNYGYVSSNFEFFTQKISIFRVQNYTQDSPKTCGLVMDRACTTCLQARPYEHVVSEVDFSCANIVKLYKSSGCVLHKLSSKIFKVFNQFNSVCTPYPHPLLKLLLPYILIIRKG